MICYHGTTDRSARRIMEDGFLPRKPSRRVWFAHGHGYALGRAKTKARRAHARPVVLKCDVDLGRLRERLGKKKVFQRGGVIAVDGPVPASVVRSGAEPLDAPATPRDLADWVNHVLGVKPYKGVGERHPGIQRLAVWVRNRLQGRPRRGIRRSELLDVARQWLPEFFEGVEIDPERLRVVRKARLPQPQPPPPASEIDPREVKALELLENASPRRRAKGLMLLAEIPDPDLFEWCAMYLDDESAGVRLAALHAMALGEEIDAELVAPFADSPDNRVRGAAIAALARHGGRAAAKWFERGLKDPSTCVRLETAHALSALDPARHRRIFQLALYDPNPQIAHLAEKLTTGKGYPKVTWGLKPSHYGEEATPTDRTAP